MEALLVNTFGGTGWQDDSVKPSRVNRRPKKKWRKPKSFLIQHGLTELLLTAILKSLSVGKLSGVRSPFYQGQKMTAPFAVFFRLPFRAELIRFYTVMAGLFGQPHGWPRLDAVLRTHSNPPPKVSKSFSSGLSTLSRILRMNAQTPWAKSAQTTPVFNIYHHRQAIARGVAGSVAMRFKRRFPACIIKFSGFAAFTPKFEHRLSARPKAGKPITLGDLTDTILLTCDRASAILHVMSLQFARLHRDH
jgi:hypothetical protein